MPDATPEAHKEVKQIQSTLLAARAGGASVTQLALAHEMAEKHGLINTTAELRRHIRLSIPDPMNGPLSIGRSILLGIISGLLTWTVVRSIPPKTSPRISA